MVEANISREQLAQASESDSFREALRREPKAAIEKEFGIQIPKAINVEVVEETPSKLYLVLPLDADDEEDVQGFFQPLTASSPHTIGLINNFLPHWRSIRNLYKLF